MSEPLTRCRGCRLLVGFDKLEDWNDEPVAASAAEEKAFRHYYCRSCYDWIRIVRYELYQRGAEYAAQEAAGGVSALHAVLACRTSRDPLILAARARVIRAVRPFVPQASNSEIGELLGCSRDAVRKALASWNAADLDTDKGL